MCHYNNFIYRSLLKTAVIITPLLGCTWVIGLLAINEDTAVFAWAFTILNSLQVLHGTIQCFTCFGYFLHTGSVHLCFLCAEE